MTNYTNTIQFSSSDPGAVLPSGGQDLVNGTQTFPVTLNTVGPRNISVLDDSPFLIAGASPVIRVETVGVSDNAITLASTRAPLTDAFFRNDNVIFTATVVGASSAPVGVVRYFDGVTDLGTSNFTGGSGVTRTATKSFPHLPVGDHPITAVFEPPPASGFTTNMSGTLVQHRFPAPRCKGDVCPGAH